MKLFSCPSTTSLVYAHSWRARLPSSPFGLRRGTSIPARRRLGEGGCAGRGRRGGRPSKISQAIMTSSLTLLLVARMGAAAPEKIGPPPGVVIDTSPVPDTEYIGS